MADDGRYTEGVCGDGAAILLDGRPMRISEVLDVLNAASRTREAERALAAEALRAALAMQEKAVAAERERCGSNDPWAVDKAAEIAGKFGRRDNVVDLQNAIMVALHTAAGKYSYNLDAFNHGRDEILDRLKNPDEVLIEAMRGVWAGRFSYDEPAVFVDQCRALAATLGKEDDNDL